MIPGFVDSLEFENVHLDYRKIIEEYNIYFSLNGFEYNIKAKSNKHPILIRHEFYDKQTHSHRQAYARASILGENTEKRCEYCGAPEGLETRCEGLEPYLDEIWEKLIQHPSVRLRFLFK